MGKELEVKLHVGDVQTLARVLAWDALAPMKQGEPEVLRMETTYFDTRDGLFSARRWTVRRRMENGRSIVCVKTPRGEDPARPLLRGEWELEASSVCEALPALVAQGAPEELRSVAEADLVTVCGARFVRRAQRLRLPDGSECELALDSGTLFHGDSSQDFCEIELELKAGSEAQMLVFGKLLAAEFGLHVEPKSKFARARAL